MRLTLRTLLAYMHDLLDPEDAQTVGKKIVESPRATELLHRLRNVTRKMRLSAPGVLDQSSGLDPNTVAEYLDNTLPENQVLDFEKVCLEPNSTQADIHLAEVASCHQVLAMVLGEPAEVDPDSRQRMYHLPEVAAATPLATETQTAETANTAPAGTVEATPSKTAVESAPAAAVRRDPIREAGKWRAITGIAVVLLAVLAILSLSGQFGPDTFLGGLWSSREPAPSVPDGQPEDVNAIAPAGIASQGASPAENNAGKSTQGQATTPEEQKAKAEASAEDAGTTVAPEKPAADQSPDKSTQPPSGEKPHANDMDNGASKPPVEPAGPESGKAEPPSSNPSATTERIGVFASPKQVLVKFNVRTNAWERIAEQTFLSANDRLIALPAQRPVVLLIGKMRVELLGGTHVTLLPPGPEGAAGLAVEQGRVVLRPEAANSQIRLSLGNQIGLASFPAAETVIAVETTRADVPGSDPETQPGQLLADLFVASGKMVWQEEPSGQQATVNTLERLALGQREPNEPTRPLPPWIDVDTTSPLDQRAALILDRGMEVARGAGAELRELVGDRRREVHWLALRALSQCYDFEPLLRALDDPDEKPYWVDYIDELRAAVRSGPHMAASVRTAMENRYGPEGATLYEMLWKYHPKTYQQEDALHLVDFLDHDRLAFRVLSWWNLRNITGLTILYKPEDTSLKRQVGIQKWRERLRAAPNERAAPGGAKAPLSPQEMLEGDDESP